MTSARLGTMGTAGMGLWESTAVWLPIPSTGHWHMVRRQLRSREPRGSARDSATCGSPVTWAPAWDREDLVMDMTLSIVESHARHLGLNEADYGGKCYHS